MIQSTKA